jgi:hypothetical protein
MFSKIIKLGFLSFLGLLLLWQSSVWLSPKALGGVDPEWDRSSLIFTGACQGDCEEIQATICNSGDGDMTGSVNYEVWYIPTGNPKSGTQVGGGLVSPLTSGSCLDLTLMPSLSGNYMFRAYQRPGHPGTGELWSEQCSISDCNGASPSPSPVVSPSPTPTPSGCPWPSFPPFPSCSPYPSFPPCPSPSPSACPSPSPSLEPSPSPEVSPSPSEAPLGGGEPQGCNATVPDAPVLLSATKSGSEATLAWTAVDPVTHYNISYGLSSGNYQYGVDNTGNVTNYVVGGLDPNADYCFVVRAVNDCAPSNPSNEICTGAAGQVLGASTLAETGSLSDEFFQILFIIGSVCSGLGLKLFLPLKKRA